jgi:TDG/mug DNA glycosylase family protein
VTVSKLHFPLKEVRGGLPDIIGDRLAVLFCGINPGMMAAATGHHFAGRGNRFWRVIHLAGFTTEQIAPEQDRKLFQFGCGLTTVLPNSSGRNRAFTLDALVGAYRELHQEAINSKRVRQTSPD